MADDGASAGSTGVFARVWVPKTQTPPVSCGFVKWVRRPPHET